MQLVVAAAGRRPRRLRPGPQDVVAALAPDHVGAGGAADEVVALEAETVSLPAPAAITSSPFVPLSLSGRPVPTIVAGWPAQAAARRRPRPGGMFAAVSLMSLVDAGAVELGAQDQRLGLGSPSRCRAASTATPGGAGAAHEALVDARAVEVGAPDRVALDVCPVDVPVAERQPGGAAGAEGGDESPGMSWAAFETLPFSRSARPIVWDVYSGKPAMVRPVEMAAADRHPGGLLTSRAN